MDRRNLHLVLLVRLVNNKTVWQGFQARTIYLVKQGFDILFPYLLFKATRAASGRSASVLVVSSNFHSGTSEHLESRALLLQHNRPDLSMLVSLHALPTDDQAFI